MSTRAWAVGGGGVLGLLLLVPMLSAVLTTADQQTQQQAPASGGATLNAASIPTEYVALVERAAATCADESAPLIAAQIAQESAWNPRAVSRAGAQGIAQFMPGTWAGYGNGGDVFDPADAIPAQARMMCDLFAQVKAAQADGRITKGTVVQNALASYNAGFGRVLRSSGFPTGIAETDSYVPSILSMAQKFTAAPVEAGGGAIGSAGAAAAVEVAKRFQGYPYVWGGGDLDGPTGYLDSPGPPVGFDCSGLTRYAVYQATHIDIGAGTVSQIDSAPLRTVVTRQARAPMPLAQMTPGDVVLINWGGRADPQRARPSSSWGHVALYMGGGQFIHAPHTGDVVRVAPASHFDSAGWIVRRLK